MDQYNPNSNRDDAAKSSPSNNSDHRVPEYSFWAEQVTHHPNHQNPYNYNYNRNISYPPNQVPNSYSNISYSAYDLKNQNLKKPKSKIPGFIMKAICFGLIAFISFFGFQLLLFQVYPEAKDYGLQLRDSDANSSIKEYKIEFTKPGMVQQVSRSEITKVVDDTIPSIVSIRTTMETRNFFGYQYGETEGSGSGIIVGKDEQELLIATNNHVVSGATSIQVTFIDNTTADAIIKGTDTIADLAVISVDITSISQDTMNSIKIAKLGNSDEIKVGEMSIAIGNALGYGQSVTVGYISAKDREVDVSDGYSYNKMIFLQTDAAINPGNSGGALLNIKGEVIGINTIKYASEKIEGMGYAIPITRATPIIHELMTREILSEEEQGWLGVSGRDVIEEVSQALNLPIGVYLVEVAENGAAKEAGLRPGDIITRVNNIEITSITQLSEYITSLRIGTEVEVTYMRNVDGAYKEFTVTIALGANPFVTESE
ncbi:MAG TPA: PDZ domain-containing protein [Clostridiales bacterium]|nr:PDZ domain-containing protein [Clostridiales bacterium]